MRKISSVRVSKPGFNEDYCKVGKSRMVQVLVNTTSMDYQTVYEGKIWCLCTVTFSSMSLNLKRLYGISRVMSTYCPNPRRKRMSGVEKSENFMVEKSGLWKFRVEARGWKVYQGCDILKTIYNTLSNNFGYHGIWKVPFTILTSIWRW